MNKMSIQFLGKRAFSYVFTIQLVFDKNYLLVQQHLKNVLNELGQQKPKLRKGFEDLPFKHMISLKIEVAFYLGSHFS